MQETAFDQFINNIFTDRDAAMRGLARAHGWLRADHGEAFEELFTLANQRTADIQAENAA